MPGHVADIKVLSMDIIRRNPSVFFLSQSARPVNLALHLFGGGVSSVHSQIVEAEAVSDVSTGLSFISSHLQLSPILRSRGRRGLDL